MRKNVNPRNKDLRLNSLDKESTSMESSEQQPVVNEKELQKCKRIYLKPYEDKRNWSKQYVTANSKIIFTKRIVV